MAITKLVSPSTPNPTGTGAGASWDLAMAQLTAVKKILSGEQMLLTQWTNTSTMPKLALGIYLQHLGAIYVVDSADYTIPTPSSDGTYYVKLTISGETLTVSVVSSLTGFSWSSQHNGLYNASNEQILPYQIVRGGAGTTFEKRKILNLANATNAFTAIDYTGKVFGSALAVTGAINASHINTGQGDFKIGQNLRVTDNVEFGVILSHGRVYDEGSSYTQEIINAQAGDVVVYASDALNTVSNTEGSNLPYTKMKEILVNITGTVTVRFTQSHSVNSYTDTHARIYKNGIAVGTEWEGSSSDIVRSQNFNVIKGDLIQIYGKVTAHVSTSEGTVKVSNFRISTLRGFSG